MFGKHKCRAFEEGAQAVAAISEGEKKAGGFGCFLLAGPNKMYTPGLYTPLHPPKPPHLPKGTPIVEHFATWASLGDELCPTA
jgi:hypothetical protein